MAKLSEFESNVDDSKDDRSLMHDEDFATLQHQFDDIIQDLPAYGPSLARIKMEYEKVLKVLEDTKRVNVLVTLEQDKATSDKHTYKNFSKHKVDLERKIAHLVIENEKLKNDIGIVRDICLMRMKEKERRQSPYHVRFPISSADRRSLHLSTEDAINVSFLQNEASKLKQELNDIRFNTEKRFLPMSTKLNLQQQLMDKEKEKEKLERNNTYLCHLHLQLNDCIKAAKSYYSSITDHSSPTVKLSDYILQSLKPISFRKSRNALDSLVEENEEEEKEAEFVLNCCQRFNKLFNNENYSEAALVAATSPQGVLRTLETLYKFKEVSVDSNSPSPLMLYCTALMDTASTYPPVSQQESQECLECAVNHKDMMSLAKWINQDSLSLSKDMGVYLYESCQCQKNCCCQCCTLALVVFRKLNCPYEECICLAKLGKHNAVLRNIQNQKYTKHEIASLLSTVSSNDLALSLISPPNAYTPFLHLFEALYVLLQKCSAEHCVNLVKSYAVLKQKSSEEILHQETQARPDLVSEVIPLLSKHSELNWMVEELLISHTVTNVISNAVASVDNLVSLQSTSLTSTYSTISIGSSKQIVRSQQFDDGEDIKSDSTASSFSIDSDTDI